MAGGTGGFLQFSSEVRMDEILVGDAEHDRDKTPRHGRYQTAFALLLVRLQERRPLLRPSRMENVMRTITTTSVDGPNTRRACSTAIGADCVGGCEGWPWFGGAVAPFCGTADEGV